MSTPRLVDDRSGKAAPCFLHGGLAAFETDHAIRTGANPAAAKCRYQIGAMSGTAHKVGACDILPANEVLRILKGSHEPQSRGLAGLGG